MESKETVGKLSVPAMRSFWPPIPVEQVTFSVELQGLLS